MELKIIMDNLTYDRNLVAEHGLSYYLKDDNLKILFDTGQSNKFVENAENMNIDLKDCDYLILSHGHYDHSGGIKYFFEINSKAKLLCKKEVFFKKFSKSTGRLREIGIELDYEKYKDRIQFVEDGHKIGENIEIITSTSKEKEATGIFFIEKDNKMLDDFFEDELFIIAKEKIIISACSHRGVAEICQEGIKRRNIDTFIGGMHLSKEKYEKVEGLAKSLKQMGIKKIITGHCTGVDSYATIKTIIPDTNYASCGKIFDL
jgi:7,8-dihydropterin-6-yl-methyl-4-(beta-D-ribofuranosyl)aminobenzene 5'-phosphate synthase